MTPDVVVFPDAAALLCGHLADVLGELTDSKIPNPRPDTFIVVRRLGGIRATIVSDLPLLAVECYALTAAEAHDLAQRARGEIHALAGQTVDGVPIYKVDDASGPADLPDALSTQSRYTFTVQVHLRGSVFTGS